MSHRSLLVSSVILLGACSASSTHDDEATSNADDAIGAAHVRVFTLSNEAAGNRILVFAADKNGALQQTASIDTGGLGNDAGLGSQGALTLSGDGRWLFAINAGSNDVSVLR